MLNKVKIATGIVVIAGMAIWLIGGQIAAGSTIPGTVNDPLITKSYVDMKIGELKAELMAVIDGLGTVMDMGPSLFNVVEATNGQRLICGASAELILRAGAATVIAGSEGDGLANLTSGIDLRGGDQVPLQHHLLVSRDDGRGFLITSDDDKGKSYILVKGDYTLE